MYVLLFSPKQNLIVMINIESLINEGNRIKAGLKYVPSEPGIIRMYSVYRLEDRVEYSTWKNQAFIYIKNKLNDIDALKRFEDYANLFEKNHYNPMYLDNILGILNAYMLSGIEEANNNNVDEIKGFKNKVFVVHGHAEEVNQDVARTIEKLGLEAIVLREQPNIGKTIIEKFEDYSKDVDYAVILLTADDKIEGEDFYRARQNVIFEMGYFMGALGRNHVMCMLQENVQRPGDIDGVVYTIIDKAGVWKYSLVKELRACGYDVDANRIL